MCVFVYGSTCIYMYAYERENQQNNGLRLA